MVNFFAVCGCCTRTDIVREHLEDTLRICDVSAMGLYTTNTIQFPYYRVYKKKETFRNQAYC
jgi:S-ribosylhomocysteine lyase LuxS involved in autoinducer biosynthesis